MSKNKEESKKPKKRGPKPKKKPVNKGGRPPKYKKEFDDQARKLCLLGYTDEKLADFFGVTVFCIDKWKQKYPKFLQALKEGKEKADSEVVSKLFEKAMGYEHDDVHITNYQGEITITPIKKYYPPDTAAAKFILMNRQKWSDKQNVDSKVEGKLEISWEGDDED